MPKSNFCSHILELDMFVIEEVEISVLRSSLEPHTFGGGEAAASRLIEEEEED